MKSTIFLSASFNEIQILGTMDRRGRYRMVVGFETTYAISANPNKDREFESSTGEVCLI